MADSRGSTIQAATSTRNGRWEFLDVIRGIAALLVFAVHGPQRWLVGTFNYGTAGVVAFFLISGFLVPASLDRYRSLPRFWSGRLLRILPLYYVLLLVVLVRFVVVLGGRSHALLQPRLLLANLLLVQNVLHAPFLIYPSWTLTYDFLFYVVCSVLFVLGLRRYAAAAVWAGVAVSILTTLALRFDHRSIAATATGLILTALYGNLVFHYAEGRQPLLKLLLPLPTVFLAVGFAAAQHHSLDNSQWNGAVAESTFGILLAWILGFLLFAVPFLLRHRQWPLPLRWLGQISYSIYLVHPVLRTLLPRIAVQTSLYFAIILPLTLVVSAVTYYFVERPAMNLQHRLFPRPPLQARTAQPLATEAA